MIMNQIQFGFVICDFSYTKLDLLKPCLSIKKVVVQYFRTFLDGFLVFWIFSHGQKHIYNMSNLNFIYTLKFTSSD